MNWWDKNYKRSDFRGWIAQDSNSTRKSPLIWIDILRDQV